MYYLSSTAHVQFSNAVGDMHFSDVFQKGGKYPNKVQGQSFGITDEQGLRGTNPLLCKRMSGS